MHPRAVTIMMNWSPRAQHASYPRFQCRNTHQMVTAVCFVQPLKLKETFQQQLNARSMCAQSRTTFRSTHFAIPLWFKNRTFGVLLGYHAGPT